MAVDKKIALVTGANRGIGLETARQLAREGITVIVAARSLANARKAAATLEQEKLTVFPVQLDITKSEDQKAAARLVAEKYGVLDILVNNAGEGPSDGLLVKKTIETTEEELQRAFGTNLFSVVALTREFLPLLKKSPAGRIVNVSSILGSLTLQSNPNGPLEVFKAFAYDASKSALNAFTIHLASELKNTNIKVNSVHPGWVKTEMGTEHAPMEVADGAKTSVQVALVAANGPNGRFIHLGQELPW